MITGETFITYAMYAKIPAEPTEEDLDILDAMDIEDSMFVIAPTMLTKGNDGFTFTPWMLHSDTKVFRIERGDIIISSPLSRKITPEFDKYIAEEKISLQDEISRLLNSWDLNLKRSQKTMKKK
jgi:hypothetical protein